MAKSGGFNNTGQAMSPPGAMSQRTDMQAQAAMDIPDAAYGEQKDFQEIQSGAPMSGGPAMPRPVPLTSASSRPKEPITTGADMGAGAGREILPRDQSFNNDMQMIAKYLPAFDRMAAQEGTPETFRQFVRFIRGNA